MKKVVQAQTPLEQAAIPDGDAKGDTVCRFLEDAKKVANRVTCLSDMIFKLKGARQKIMSFLEDESVAEDLTSALLSPVMDIESLTAILTSLATKVWAEAADWFCPWFCLVQT